MRTCEVCMRFEKDGGSGGGGLPDKCWCVPEGLDIAVQRECRNFVAIGKKPPTERLAEALEAMGRTPPRGTGGGPIGSGGGGG